MIKKIGASFHESFGFSRNSLKTIIYGLTQLGSAASGAELHSATLIGSAKVAPFIYYAQGMGMLNSKREQTLFGTLAFANDPTLAQLHTQWICHYNMVKPHGHGPEAWLAMLEAVFKGPYEGLPISSLVDLQDELAAAKGKTLKIKTKEINASVFKRSYMNAEGLSALELLAEPQKSVLQIGNPAAIPLPAFAYMLADFWEATFPERTQLGLDELTESKLPTLLLLTSRHFRQHLDELAKPSVGLVSIQDRVPPAHIVRNWTSAEALLEQVYA